MKVKLRGMKGVPKYLSHAVVLLQYRSRGYGLVSRLVNNSELVDVNNCWTAYIVKQPTELSHYSDMKDVFLDLLYLS